MVENQILSFIHCAKCLDEKPDNVSPKDWSMTQTGFTADGIQVWCNRHDCNVVHIPLRKGELS